MDLKLLVTFDLWGDLGKGGSPEAFADITEGLPGHAKLRGAAGACNPPQVAPFS